MRPRLDRFAAAVAIAVALIAIGGEPAPARLLNAPLWVCADPNNLPFSNQRREGFENKLAALAARDLGRALDYTWWPQRRGFFRSTLDAKLCDVVIGVPSDFEMALTTKPYYRSAYAFVTRRDRGLLITSLDDERLRTLRIGVHVIGDDYASVPPAQALSARGIVQNVRGYSIYGDYSQPNPPATLVDAVSEGAIDVAIAWGPIAGYFAAQAKHPLAVRPLEEQSAAKGLPLTFAISMGVRRGDTALKTMLDEVIARRAGEIAALLGRYHVPTLPLSASR